MGLEVDGVEKTDTVELLALDYVPPKVVVSAIENDKEMITTVYGSVNWNGLEPDKIIVDWGDGNKSEGEKFPFDHQYERWGNYNISISAVSVEGSIGLSEEKFECKEPPPPPPPSPKITHVDFNEEMPAEYTIELEVDVKWINNRKGKIHIEWGDKKETKSSRSVFKHKYPDEVFAIYFMTITAVDRDGIKSKPRRFSVFMLFGFYCLIGEL